MEDDYSESDSDSEESVYISPAAAKFGDTALVNCVYEAQQLRTLVSDGHAITASTILAASYIANADSLEILLAASQVSPNIRFEEADSDADADTLSKDQFCASTDIAPTFGIDKKEWYPLHHAAKGNTHAAEEKAARKATSHVLLQRQPDLYALFKQPIWRSLPFPFPGERGEDKTPWNSPEAIARKQGITLRTMIDGEWQRLPTPECGYGLRSLLHAMFEDGAFVEPILKYPGLQIELERRDPLGRTLLHAVCRNALGADARIDGMSEDLFCQDNEHSKEQLVASPGTESSLFQHLIGLGADLYAVDQAGKNILHHLFEARASHPYTFTHVPFIRNSVQYIIQNASALINQPDGFGTYPLHTALQRFRHYVNLKQPIDIAEMEPLVHGLLDAGAFTEVQDSRGNTALHYFADTGLVERHDTDPQIILADCFFAHGPDVNTRNTSGRTAVELALGDFDYMIERGLITPMASFRRQAAEEVELEVLEKFDRAGARWGQVNPDGQTLLHIVAGQGTKKASFRSRYLLDKGVDSGVKDRDGNTAADVARKLDNQQVLDVLLAHND